MSFADDFDHYIPPDDWGGDGGSYGKYGSYPSKYTRNYRSNYINYGALPVTKTFIEVVAETEKSYLIEFKEGKAWVPKREIDLLDMDNLKLKIPQWLASKLVYIQSD